MIAIYQILKNSKIFELSPATSGMNLCVIPFLKGCRGEEPF